MANWYDDFEYDEELAKKADSAADRLSSTGPYVGKFTRVSEVTSSTKGTHGIELEFQLEGFDGEAGKTTASIWTARKDGEKIGFGSAFLHALLCILKEKKPVPKNGKVLVWDNGKKVETDGVRFPNLEGKAIGVVWQKEIGDKGNKFNIAGFFDPKTRLTATEISKGVTKPEKLAALLKNTKDKDSRTNKAERPDVFGDDGADSGGSLM